MRRACGWWWSWVGGVVGWCGPRTAHAQRTAAATRCCPGLCALPPALCNGHCRRASGVVLGVVASKRASATTWVFRSDLAVFKDRVLEKVISVPSPVGVWCAGAVRGLACRGVVPASKVCTVCVWAGWGCGTWWGGHAHKQASPGSPTAHAPRYATTHTRQNWQVTCCPLSCPVSSCGAADARSSRVAPSPTAGGGVRVGPGLGHTHARWLWGTPVRRSRGTPRAGRRGTANGVTSLTSTRPPHGCHRHRPPPHPPPPRPPPSHQCARPHRHHPPLAPLTPPRRHRHHHLPHAAPCPPFPPPLRGPLPTTATNRG